jgi:hypothetical protein
MPERKVRGSALNPYLRYVKKKWGATGLAEFCRDNKVTEAGFKDGEWYDVAVYQKLMRWFREKKGDDALRELGRFGVTDLGFLSFIVRFMSIERMLSQPTDKTYGQAFNFGRMETELGKKRAIIRLYDVSVDENACISWLGSLQGMLDITKTKGTVRETQCQSKGAPHCEYDMVLE